MKITALDETWLLSDNSEDRVSTQETTLSQCYRTHKIGWSLAIQINTSFKVVISHTNKTCCFKTSTNSQENEIIQMLIKLARTEIGQIFLAGIFNAPSQKLSRQDATTTLWFHEQPDTSIRISRQIIRVGNAAR